MDNLISPLTTFWPPNMTVVTVKVTKPRMTFKTSANSILGYADLTFFWLAFAYTILSSLVVSFSAKKNVSVFFFSNRNVGFFPMTCSMMLANIGSVHFVGMAAFASKSGLAPYAFELNATLAFIILGWIFLPVYLASGSVTTIDYLKKRYGGKRIELYISCMSLVLLVITRGSVELFSLFKIMEIFFDNPDPYTISLPFLVWSVIVACTGGLRSVVYTSTAEFIIISIGCGFISYYCYTSFETYDLLKDKFFQAWPNTTKAYFGDDSSYPYTYCGIPQPSSWNLIREYNNYDMPWPGMVFGVTINSIWYFCCDQVIVQSALGACSLTEGKTACILSGYIKILGVFFLILPGIVARIFYTDIVACAEPEVCQQICHSKYGCPNMAFPLLFLHIVPQNYRGILLAAVLLCGVTSMVACLHSGGSIVAFNIYKYIRPNVSAMELLIITKLAIVTIAFFSYSSIALVSTTPSIIIFVQETISLLAPPISAVYLCGIFWDRTNEKAAFRTLMFGCLLGIMRILWQLSVGSVVCGEESSTKVPHILARFHYLHFSIFVFVLCVSYMVISGIFSEPVGIVHLYRLTFWLRHSKLDRVDIDELDEAYEKLMAKRRETLSKDLNDADSTTSTTGKRDFRFPIIGNACCLSTDTASHIINTNELREIVKANTNIDQKPGASRALDIHALVLLLLSAVLWGYFS